jgi:hypothetical protein
MQHILRSELEALAGKRSPPSPQRSILSNAVPPSPNSHVAIAPSVASFPNSSRPLARPVASSSSSSSSSLLLSNSIPRTGEVSAAAAADTVAQEIKAEAEVDKLVIIEQCRMLKQV